MLEYTKPHLTHAQQLAQLVGRGLACSDETAAIDLLKTVGYYRLSAYIYPFRELISGPPDEQGSDRPLRSDMCTARASMQVRVLSELGAVAK